MTRIDIRCTPKFKDGIRVFANTIGMNSTDFIKKSIRGYIEYVNAERHSKEIRDHYGFRVITHPNVLDFENIILEGQD